MDRGFGVVIGMTVSYAVSFFGLLLAYIVYQRNNHRDDLWRKRPVGVTFFSILYGYILPLLFLGNVILTLGIKLFKGWDFNSFVWSTEALTWPIPAGIVLFWLVGRLFWRMKATGYSAAVAMTVLASFGLLYLLAVSIPAGAPLQRLGVYTTGLIWHSLWSVYFLSSKVRGTFLKQGLPA